MEGRRRVLRRGGGRLAVAEISGSRPAGGVVAIVLLAAFAAAISRRPDGQGWPIFAALIVVGAPLSFVSWPAGIELAAFVTGAMLFALLGFDPRPGKSAAVPTRADGSGEGAEPPGRVARRDEQLLPPR